MNAGPGPLEPPGEASGRPAGAGVEGEQATTDGNAPHAAGERSGERPGERPGGLRALARALLLPFGRLAARFPSVRSRRGLFLLTVLVGGLASALTIGTVVAIQWTETTSFCGQCHTMAPELKAYDMSAHRDVACVECHTKPGVEGWVETKVNGTKQLVQIVTGTFPKPIPPPDHTLLPPTAVTCQRCHDIVPLVANGGPVKLVLHNRYAKDEAVTRQSIALVLRPFGFGGSGETQGVHWHIASNVEYAAADPQAQQIDYVAVDRGDGDVEEFIAASAVTVSSEVGPDIARLKATDGVRRMDCIDCHNRVGHGILGLDQAIDAQIDAGTV
ncbi:MAG TPA: NapC/NirT family cytochrome c, partial [Candidatus Limnocylindrales bacterium]